MKKSNRFVFLPLFFIAFGVIFAGAARAQAPVQKFKNTKTNLPKNLAENYVDFSFEFPAGWEKRTWAESSASSDNFVQVQRRKDGEVLESFGVGRFAYGAQLPDNRRLSEILNEFARVSFSPALLAFQKLSEGEIRIGGQRAYELTFIGIDGDENLGDAVQWGRLILMPGRAGEDRGVFIIINAKSRAPELKTIRDVGTKGELPVILNSFRLGADEN